MQWVANVSKTLAFVSLKAFRNLVLGTQLLTMRNVAYPFGHRGIVAQGAGAVPGVIVQAEPVGTRAARSAGRELVERGVRKRSVHTGVVRVDRRSSQDLL